MRDEIFVCLFPFAIGEWICKYLSGVHSYYSPRGIDGCVGGAQGVLVCAGNLVLVCSTSRF